MQLLPSYQQYFLTPTSRYFFPKPPFILLFIFYQGQEQIDNILLLFRVMDYLIKKYTGENNQKHSHHLRQAQTISETCYVFMILSVFVTLTLANHLDQQIVDRTRVWMLFDGYFTIIFLIIIFVFKVIQIGCKLNTHQCLFFTIKFIVFILKTSFISWGLTIFLSLDWQNITPIITHLLYLYFASAIYVGYKIANCLFWAFVDRQPTNSTVIQSSHQKVSREEVVQKQNLERGNMAVSSATNFKYSEIGVTTNPPTFIKKKSSMLPSISQNPSSKQQLQKHQGSVNPQFDLKKSAINIQCPMGLDSTQLPPIKEFRGKIGVKRTNTIDL